MKNSPALLVSLLAAVATSGGCRDCGKQPQTEPAATVEKPVPVAQQIQAEEQPPPAPANEPSPQKQQPEAAMTEKVKTPQSFPMEPGRMIPMFSKQAAPTKSGQQPTSRAERVRGTVGQLSRYQESRPSWTYQTATPKIIPEEKGGRGKKGTPPPGAVPIGKN